MPTGHIIVETYFDDDGNRTCAADFNNGRVCAYYRTQRLGTYETCVFAPEHRKYAEQLNRRGAENLGSLIPAEWCPIEPVGGPCLHSFSERAKDFAEVSRLEDYADDYPGFDPLDSDDYDWRDI